MWSVLILILSSDTAVNNQRVEAGTSSYTSVQSSHNICTRLVTREHIEEKGQIICESLRQAASPVSVFLNILAIVAKKKMKKLNEITSQVDEAVQDDVASVKRFFP